MHPPLRTLPDSDHFFRSSLFTLWSSHRYLSSRLLPKTSKLSSMYPLHKQQEETLKMQIRCFPPISKLSALPRLAGVGKSRLQTLTYRDLRARPCRLPPQPYTSPRPQQSSSGCSFYRERLRFSVLMAVLFIRVQLACLSLREKGAPTPVGLGSLHIACY